MRSTGVLPEAISGVGHAPQARCSVEQRSARALGELLDIKREQQLGRSLAELDPISTLAAGEHGDVIRDDFGLGNADDFLFLNKLPYG
jgi:hypothetical protein